MSKSKSKSDYIDLNSYAQFLTRHKKKGYYECPVCTGKLSISRGNGTKFTCYGDGCAHSDIRKATLALAGEDTTYSQEFLAKREQIAEERAQAERDRKSVV